MIGWFWQRPINRASVRAVLPKRSSANTLQIDGPRSCRSEDRDSSHLKPKTVVPCESRERWLYDAHEKYSMGTLRQSNMAMEHTFISDFPMTPPFIEIFYCHVWLPEGRYINHERKWNWSHVHQLSKRSRAPPCRDMLRCPSSLGYWGLRLNYKLSCSITLTNKTSETHIKTRRHVNNRQES